MAAALIFSLALILFFLHTTFIICVASIVDRQFVTRYLQKYGYLDSRENNSELDREMLTSGIKLYQLTYGLPVTGHVDNSTLRLMLKPRCGITDLGMRRSRSRSRSPVDGQSEYEFMEGKPRWKKGELMYRYEMNEDMPRGIDYEGAIFRAFQRWEAVCRGYFDFRQLADYDIPTPPERLGDIHIGWFAGDHGDGDPFDGRGGTLAHALPAPRGDLHFDADEIWTNDEEAVAKDGLEDLESVAVHEIGHVLGLDHSDVEEAVMYSVSQYGEVKRDLHRDDIEGIRALYPFCNPVAN